MESLDTRESITELALGLLDWLREQPRTAPFTIRLVKGAYWDHEVVMAAQNGWESPVFTDRRSCDRHYEHLTRRLLGSSRRVASARTPCATGS
jgi:proline dehydrogenase